MTHTTPPSPPPETIFLKLGGSLITDKRRAETPRSAVIARLAGEIVAAREDRPGLRLVIGHGSGSFGHVAGRRYGTREGVRTPEAWRGFAITADAAARLNRIVVAALLEAGAPAWGIQPGATLRCQDGMVVDGPHATVASALDRGLTPVVFGDVALDSVRGGTIASTEEIFDWLAGHLHPARLILAGEVDGVFSADPQLHSDAERLPEITPAMLGAIESGLGGSHGVDVTGGMTAKVRQALALVQRHPGLDVVICSGLIPGNLQRILTTGDAETGTRIRADG
jgi:isopentenyl phosphate kinase